jgi:hypothetical protein
MFDATISVCARVLALHTDLQHPLLTIVCGLLVLMMIKPCTILKEGRGRRWDTMKATAVRVEKQNHFSLTEKCRSIGAHSGRIGCPFTLWNVTRDVFFDGHSAQ